jgi:hypothetical protein
MLYFKAITSKSMRLERFEKNMSLGMTFHDEPHVMCDKCFFEPH